MGKLHTGRVPEWANPWDVRLRGMKDRISPDTEKTLRGGRKRYNERLCIL